MDYHHSLASVLGVWMGQAFAWYVPEWYPYENVGKLNGWPSFGGV